MKKKLLSLLLASTMAVSAVGALAACGGGKGTKKPVDHTLSANLPTVTNLNDPLANLGADEDLTAVPACTLTVWAPQASIAKYTELANEFKSASYKNGKYANVTINFLNVEEDQAVSTIGSDATTAGDLFFFPSDHIEKMYENNILQPLSSKGEGEYYTAAIAKRDVESTVEPIVYNGYCYAFPATSDNGYFMWYDTAVVGDNDVATLDGIIAKCKAAGKNVMFDLGGGYYDGMFFMGNGALPCGRSADGSYYTDITSDKGKAAAKAMLGYLSKDSASNQMANGKPVLIAGGESEMRATLGTTTAVCIQGAWLESNGNKDGNTWSVPSTVKVTKLPTYTLEGKQVQMGSFMGGKYCGVNAQRPNVKVAMALANYFTNEKGQDTRFAATNSGPSNKVSAAKSDVQADKYLKALSAQNAAGGVMQVGISDPYWTAIGGLSKLMLANTVGDLDKALADTAAAIVG